MLHKTSDSLPPAQNILLNSLNLPLGAHLLWVGSVKSHPPKAKYASSQWETLLPLSGNSEIAVWDLLSMSMSQNVLQEYSLNNRFVKISHHSGVNYQPAVRPSSSISSTIHPLKLLHAYNLRTSNRSEADLHCLKTAQTSFSWMILNFRHAVELWRPAELASLMKIPQQVHWGDCPSSSLIQMLSLMWCDLKRLRICCLLDLESKWTTLHSAVHQPRLTQGMLIWYKLGSTVQVGVMACLVPTCSRTGVRVGTSYLRSCCIFQIADVASKKVCQQVHHILAFFSPPVSVCYTLTCCRSPGISHWPHFNLCLPVAIMIEINGRNDIKIIPADEALLVRVRLKFSGSAEEFVI